MIKVVNRETIILSFNPQVRKIPWRRKWQPTTVFLPRESHGQRSLVGYSPRSWNELDMTEQLTTMLGSARWRYYRDILQTAVDLCPFYRSKQELTVKQSHCLISWSCVIYVFMYMCVYIYIHIHIYIFLNVDFLVLLTKTGTEIGQMLQDNFLHL